MLLLHGIGASAFQCNARPRMVRAVRVAMEEGATDGMAELDPVQAEQAVENLRKQLEAATAKLKLVERKPPTSADATEAMGQPVPSASLPAPEPVVTVQAPVETPHLRVPAEAVKAVAEAADKAMADAAEAISAAKAAPEQVAAAAQAAPEPLAAAEQAVASAPAPSRAAFRGCSGRASHGAGEAAAGAVRGCSSRRRRCGRCGDAAAAAGGWRWRVRLTRWRVRRRMQRRPRRSRGEAATGAVEAVADAAAGAAGAVVEAGAVAVGAVAARCPSGQRGGQRAGLLDRGTPPHLVLVLGCIAFGLQANAVRGQPDCTTVARQHSCRRASTCSAGLVAAALLFSAFNALFGEHLLGKLVAVRGNAAEPPHAAPGGALPFVAAAPSPPPPSPPLQKSPQQSPQRRRPRRRRLALCHRHLWRRWRR